jgi:MFS family permease
VEQPTVATARVRTVPSRVVAPVPARLGLGRLLAINAFWFGNGAHWQPILVALIPEGAKLIVGDRASDLLVGRATAAGGVFALLVPLIVGWLSDRTRTRWGRRRPWMIAGTTLNVIGLLLLAFAWSPAALIVLAVGLQAANNISGAAYSGVIPDVVPEEQRGHASGLLGTMNQLGTVVGVLLVAIVLSVLHRTRVGLVVSYGVVATILVTTLVITVLGTRERVLPPLPRAGRPHPSAAVLIFVASALVTVGAVLALLTTAMERGTLVAVAGLALAGGAGSLAAGRRIAGLRRHLCALGDRDFRWCFLTRLFMNFGIFSIVPFMDSYFERVAGATNSGAASSYWLLAVIAGGVIPAIVGGAMSDRMGRRKPFVYVSGAIQALAASVVIFSLVSSTLALYAVGLLFGIGYGLYYAIDWALACDVLPDRENGSGRDMAIWHVSLTLPQVVAPALAALLLTYLNETHHILGMATGHNLGFRVVFGSAALWFTLGTVFVSRIRGVR